MFKVVLTLAIFVALVVAQSTPTATAACTSYVNSTATAFCSVDVTYSVVGTTDFAAANTAANTVYTNTLSQITGANDACRSAIRTFACQSSIARCGRYTPFASVAVQRCDNIRAACNTTAFPRSNCVNNTLVSVDGQNLVCIPSALAALGGSCNANLYDPAINTPSVVQSTVCPAVSSCNTTSGTCARPSNIGDSCTGVGAGTCVTSISTPGSALLCLGGKCSYSGKRHAQACGVNEECRSNNCLNGTCFESAFGGSCSSVLNCRDNLWCDARNQTCYNNAMMTEQCGIVQPNWSPVPCQFGLSCVRDNSTSNSTSGFSYCRASAQIGERCSVASTAVAYDLPLCNPTNLPSTGLAQCASGICSTFTGVLEGQNCSVINFCAPSLTCRYAFQNSTTGICSQPSTVSCDTVGGGQCNFGQQCACGNSLDQPGTCRVDTQNPLVNCAAQAVVVAQCLKTTCRNSPFVPYDGSSCGATQCLTQINAYYCCVKNTIGANYVAPAGQPAEPCVATTTVAPTSTPNPSGTPSSTGTPVPFQSSRKSGATTIALSFAAIIVAVVASL